MKEKKRRQAQIVILLKKRRITTQHQLQKILSQRGYKVNQATLSRDLQELGAIYSRDAEGKYYYKIAEVVGPPPLVGLKSQFSQYVTNVRYSGNLILIKTLPGEASGIARLIDELSGSGSNYKEFKDVLGTIAGDDTILVVVKSINRISQIIKFLNKLKGEKK